MSETVQRPKPLQSVFVRLMLTMVTLALVVLVMVSVFFGFFVGPTLGGALHGLTEEYVTLLAAGSPDLEAAKRVAARLQIEVRYEGPKGQWATAEGMPSPKEVANEELEAGSKSRLFWREHYVVPSPDGGTYLFLLSYAQRLEVLHNWILVVLLVLVTSTVFAAHAHLRRVLRPLRWLRDGVTTLSEGNLDVTVPRRTNDEFGALTDAFNRMVGRVKEMVRSRDQLLLDVSHELRSPLTRMKVALALTGESDQKDRLCANVAEMETMVTELLEIERLRDPRGITLQPQDMKKVLAEVVQAFEGRAPGVVVSAAPPEIPLRMDPEQMRRVLVNLLENATKYSLPDSRPVDVSVVEGADTIAVRVADDGPGIPEEDLPNLFEPFFRVDRSRSRKTGGYGLGLSLCKRILEAHGGTIAVKNNAERGVSFLLTLPRESKREPG